MDDAMNNVVSAENMKKDLKRSENPSNSESDIPEPLQKKFKEDVDAEEFSQSVSGMPDNSVSGPLAVATPSAKTTTSATANVDLANVPRKLSEIDVGITEYVGKHISGFTGVIKQRYSDFLVNEIDMDGNVVTLSDVRKPPEDTKNAPDVVNILGQEMINQLRAFDVETEKILFPFSIDVENRSKEERRSIHESVRALFPALESKTGDKDGRKVILVVHRPGGVPRGGDDVYSFQRGRRQVWPHDRGNYTHFALHKENVDTLEAVNLISRFLRMKSSSFSYAGVKDKRAKTVQQISVYRTEGSKILGLNGVLRNMLLGNVRYMDEQLQLGDLSGNRFRIVLRNVTGSQEEIDASVMSLTEQGFINYYGMQRFGTTSVATHLVGLALIRSHWLEAIDLILRPRAGEDSNMSECRRLWKLTKNAKRVLPMMRRQSSVEAYLLRGIIKHSLRDPVSALSMIPRNMRLMYVHSYQSYIWNCVVSRRIREHGTKVLEGDLLLSHKGVRESVVADGDAAETVLTAEEPVKGRKKYPKPTPAVFKAGDEAASPIREVVLPLPGYDVTFPSNEIAEWYNELLEKDGINLHHFEHRVKDYALAGSYRHAFVHPTNVTWNLLRYDNPEVSLLLSDKDVLDGSTLPDAGTATGARLAVRLQFDLPPSCYATMALREILRADTSAAFQSTLNVPSGTAAAQPSKED